MVQRGPATREEVQLQLLVIRCQTGDERAFTRLVEMFSARTLRYLSGLIGDGAEDVQQEVWLSVYRNLRELANPRAFRTWLFRTTRHRAIDFLRHRKRERELFTDSTSDVPEVAADDDPAADTMDEDTLAAALTVLPPAQREVLLLRHRDDLSYAEIALITGSSIGTVRSRLHHARRRMQELIARD